MSPSHCVPLPHQQRHAFTPHLASLSFAWMHFNPWLVLTYHYGWRGKKRISEVNGVKTVCFLLHQEKPASAFRAYVYQLTSLPQHGSWVVLRLPSADVSGSIWVNLGPSFISLLQLSIPRLQKKKKSSQPPDVSSNCNISKKELK